MPSKLLLLWNQSLKLEHYLTLVYRLTDGKYNSPQLPMVLQLWPTTCGAMLRILPKRGCTNYSSLKASWVVSSPNLPLQHLPLLTQLCEQLFTSSSSVAGKWFNPKRDPPRAQSFASLATHTHWKPHYQQQQRQQHWEQKQHQSMSRRATDSAAAAKPRDSEPDSSMCCGMRFIRCLRCTLRVCVSFEISWIILISITPGHLSRT